MISRPSDYDFKTVPRKKVYKSKSIDFQFRSSFVGKSSFTVSDASNSETLALRIEKEISGKSLEITASYDFFQGQVVLKATCQESQMQFDMKLEVDVAAGIDVN